MHMFNQSAVGIEITPTKVYAVLLKNKTVETYCSTLSPKWFECDQPIDCDRIASAVKSMDLKTKRVASCLPGNHVTVCDVESDDLTVDSLLKMSGNYFSLPNEELDTDCLQISQGHFILIGSERMLSDKYISIFKKANLSLEAVESTFFSLLRAFESVFHEYRNTQIVVVNMKENFAEMTVAKGHIPKLVRSLPVGLIEGDINELVEEVNYIVEDNQVTQVFLVGCGLDSRGIRKKIEVRSCRTTRNLDLFDKSVPAGYEVAYGLALRQL